MNSRLGFIGIIIENRKDAAEKVNKIISDFGENIVARIGVPYKEKQCSVITLIIDTTTDTLGNLTGKLGAVHGVSVKSALSKTN